MNSVKQVKAPVRVFMVGGSTILLRLPGLDVVTDPTLDDAAPRADGRPYRVTQPVLPHDDIHGVDLALVSHDQHPDNLDASGRELLRSIATVLTTPDGAGRLGAPVVGLMPFEESTVNTRAGTTVTVCAVPALHGPAGAEAEAGPVTGFVLTGPELPTIYISGDNASLEAVSEVKERFSSIDLALLFLGAAVVPQLLGGARLTMNAQDAVTATRLLDPRAVVPLHCDGWTHYTEGSSDVQRAFEAAALDTQLAILSPGQEVVL